MRVYWGKVSEDNLHFIEPQDVQDNITFQLPEDEVAIICKEISVYWTSIKDTNVALYGTKEQMVALAEKILEKWGNK